MAVEAEQRAWDEQGEDWNHEVFPLIVDVRDVLRTNGVPIRPGSALCGAAALCGNSPLASAAPHAEPDRRRRGPALTARSQVAEDEIAAGAGVPAGEELADRQG